MLRASLARSHVRRTPDNWQALREQMVDTQIRARDVRSAAVLQAMARVPRHLFVPDDMRAHRV